MDYETPDGSQFSLREVWTERDGEPVFDYTTISAYVDGVAYTGKLPQPPDEVDDADVLNALECVTPGCIHPPFPPGFTIAPEFDASKHYLKAPSFTYDDCRPGNTFVADCVLNEVTVLERLKYHPHPNIVTYYGCVVKDGLITHLCLQRYQCGLPEYTSRQLAASEIARAIDGIQAGIEHLHSLGLAHNDINPDNICINSDGVAVLVDFDSCLPFDEKLMKGSVSNAVSDIDIPVSSIENDLCGLATIKQFLADVDRHVA